jgi:aryl-alcohol dehydrogenase-like predicted oxidoreductase
VRAPTSRSTKDRPGRVTRRDALLMLAAGVTAPGWEGAAAPAPLSRRIPVSGEFLPAVGLGTWQAFDTPPHGAEFDAAAAALAAFLDRGGRVVDTSPMYGQAEARLGEMLARDAIRREAFLATKVWTRGREAGLRQLEQSFRLLGARTIDLVQVHNLLDFGAHWPALQEARERGRVRYLGITHYQASAHAELQRVMRSARPDFLQVNYSLAEPEAADRLLPAARDLGVAVLVNRPFTQGAMLGRARGRKLPPVAAELRCGSAAQLFLKWVLADPAVTAALVGTRNERHAVENLQAANPPLPDARQRRAIEAWFASL